MNTRPERRLDNAIDVAVDASWDIERPWRSEELLAKADAERVDMVKIPRARLQRLQAVARAWHRVTMFTTEPGSKPSAHERQERREAIAQLAEAAAALEPDDWIER